MFYLFIMWKDRVIQAGKLFGELKGSTYFFGCTLWTIVEQYGDCQIHQTAVYIQSLYFLCKHCGSFHQRVDCSVSLNFETPGALWRSGFGLGESLICLWLPGFTPLCYWRAKGRTRGQSRILMSGTTRRPLGLPHVYMDLNIIQEVLNHSVQAVS